MTRASTKEGISDMVQGLRADVTLDKVQVAFVQVEQEVSVRPQQRPAVQSTTNPAAGICECLLDVVKRFEHVKDLRVLIEQLSGEG